MPKIPGILLSIAVTICCFVQAPCSAAGSFIRVVENAGVWWFEDGRGQRFFSIGVNCIGGCFGHKEESAMEASRKRRIVAHLKDQGFNTAASWSSPSVWDQFYVADQIYLGFKEDRDDTFDDALWKEKFEPVMREEVKPFLGNENFIGYFLDNEPRWDAVDILTLYLGLPRQSPGSLALVSFLAAYYGGNIQKLNQEWGLSCRGFSEVPGASFPQGHSMAMQKGVLRAWRNHVAKTHYARYVALLRSLDPDHLILGIRYRSIPDLDLFKALSPHFDVDSVNDYNRYGDLKSEFEALHAASGKPLMITEFSFSGFLEPGHRSMLYVDVYSQENRGVGYRKYVLEAARSPFILGMHWFSWMDYHGRSETEGGLLPDENVGLVTHDESMVYKELADWIRKTNREVHANHLSSRLVPRAEPSLTTKVLRPFTPTVDGDVSEWPAEHAVKPGAVRSLHDGVSPHQTYFVSHDKEALYVGGDVSDSHMENPGGEHAWIGDRLFLQICPGKGDGAGAPEQISLFICPVGGGEGKMEPFIIRWHDFGGPTRVCSTTVTRTRAGGFIIEAKVPWSALRSLPRDYAVPNRLTVGYQNTNEIYQAHWSGLLVLKPE